MNHQTDPALNIQSRILRRSERIAKWETESNGVELSWCGGMDYRRFCQRMADNARQKQQELHAELEQLQATIGPAPSDIHPSTANEALPHTDKM